MTTQKKKNFGAVRDFGNLTEEGYSTPRRLKRNFSVVKNRLKNLSYAK